MNLGIEIKKLKRTGYAPAFLLGGLLASAFPAANMAFRSDLYLALPGDPLTILTDANWQMMAMLNLLLTVCGACIMYHTEYSDNGAQKMETLPVSAGSPFLGKFFTALLFSAAALLIETATLGSCAYHWFPGRTLSLATLGLFAGFELLMMVPTLLLMLMIASAFRTMWISLGTGVILVFLLSILPGKHLVLELCPFRSPYLTLSAIQDQGQTALYLGGCAAETVILGAAELFFLKIRRCFV